LSKLKICIRIEQSRDISQIIELSQQPEYAQRETGAIPAIMMMQVRYAPKAS